MKKLLPFIILCFISVLVSCKDDAPIDNPQPAQDTTFTSNQHYIIYHNAQNEITRYYMRDSLDNLVEFTRFYNISPAQTQTITYYPDSSVKYTCTYYLNVNGQADSMHYSDNTVSYKKLYAYDGGGFLTCTTDIPGAWPCNNVMPVYTNNNLDHIGYYYYTYCDSATNFDLFSHYRSFDNKLTGNNDAQLIKRRSPPPIGPSHYIHYNYTYKLYPNGNVSEQVTATTEFDHVSDTTTYSKLRFTYILE
jgi:hypothetical protein